MTLNLKGRVDLVDLFPDFLRITRGAQSEAGFKASLWGWLDEQRDDVLGPFLSDVERFFPQLQKLLSWAEAREVLRRLGESRHVERARAACARLEEVAGLPLDCGLILLAGLERPEGYSRFHRGRNTVHVALDHPSNLRHADHLEIILAHELTHSLRDPLAPVLADRGGSPGMSHDEFVVRYPLREHLVSEALATALSEVAYPGRPDHRYTYLDPEDDAWCNAHRAEIVARLRSALEAGESFRTFYAAGAVGPDSPECCDYFLALHLGRYLLQRTPIPDLLAAPAKPLLEQAWDSFCADFLASSPPLAVTPPTATGPDLERAAGLDLVPAETARFYRELVLELGADATRRAETEAELVSAVREAGLVYGGEPYDVCAFPMIFSQDELNYVRWVTQRLAGLFERAIELYRSDPEVRAYFALPPRLEQLALLEPGYRPFVQIGRLDSYWNGRRIQFLELNTNGTAGVLLADQLPQLAAELPLLRPLLRRHGLARLELKERLAKTLREAWRQARPNRPAPELTGILDWPDLPTATELEGLARFLTGEGLPAVVISPHELTFEGGRLAASGRPIDLVYRRLTTADIVDRADSLQPFFAACEADAAVVVGTFPADVAHSKRLFAFLTDERWRTSFSMEERALIDAHVPWTRILRPMRTLYRGQAAELRDLVLEQRERFVLKPTESYEGRGVILGVDSSPHQWAQEVARRFGGQHLVQEYVEPPQRIMHLPDGGRESRYVHLGEFLVGGDMAGLLVRASLERVLNVESMEYTLPCFVFDSDSRVSPPPPP